MRKSFVDYLVSLPVDKGGLSVNSYPLSKMPISMLTKIAEKERRDMKSRKLSRRNGSEN
jgi:hypothetical protein